MNYSFIALVCGVFAASCYIESVKRKSKQESMKKEIKIPKEPFKLIEKESIILPSKQGELTPHENKQEKEDEKCQDKKRNTTNKNKK